MFYALKRQLRIWGHEIYLIWDKIPFLGRVLLGAALSAGFAVWFSKEHLQPLKTEIQTLSKGLEIPENLDPEKDEEIIMNRDKLQRLQPAIAREQRTIKEYEDSLDFLDATAQHEVMNAFQSIFDRCGLRLVYEGMATEEKADAKNASSRRSRASAAKTPKPAADTGPIGVFKHEYKIVGNFRQIQAFLLLLEDLKWKFQVSKVSMKKSAETPGTLELSFDLSIYYLKKK